MGEQRWEGAILGRGGLRARSSSVLTVFAISVACTVGGWLVSSAGADQEQNRDTFVEHLPPVQPETCDAASCQSHETCDRLVSKSSQACEKCPENPDHVRAASTGGKTVRPSAVPPGRIHMPATPPRRIVTVVEPGGGRAAMHLVVRMLGLKIPKPVETDRKQPVISQEPPSADPPGREDIRPINFQQQVPLRPATPPASGNSPFEVIDQSGEADQEQNWDTFVEHLPPVQPENCAAASCQSHETCDRLVSKSSQACEKFPENPGHVRAASTGDKTVRPSAVPPGRIHMPATPPRRIVTVVEPGGGRAAMHLVVRMLGLKIPKPVETDRKQPVISQEPPSADPPGREDIRPINFQQQVPLRPATPPASGNSPFEVIDQSGELEVTVRRSKLLRTDVDIYRTAVVDPQICDVIQFTPREISVIGKGQGATHVTFWFRDGEHRPITYLVKVLPDPEERRRHEVQYEMLEDVLAELFPDSKVGLLLVADKLIVRGQSKDSEEAAQILAIVRGEVNHRSVRGGYGSLGEGAAARILTDQETGRQSAPRINVVNMLRVPGVQQVALRVKIAELNRSAARGFGVNLDMQIDLSNKGGSALFLESMLNMIDGGATSVLGQFDGDDISLGIRYLQQHGVLRILSEPTLVTMSGRPATFVAGGEFAVPTVVGTAGLNAVTTDFRSFGAIISFLPVVIDKDRIRLEVAPEFSQINSELQVGDTPGLDIRAVTTTVELREGQTLAIAGLLDDTMRADAIGNVPIVSWLFGRRDVTRDETELIILVTPELVHAMEPQQVPPLPGFDVTEPTNGQFFLEGKLEGDPTRQYRSTIWPRLRSRYRNGSGDMIAGPFGHGQ